MKPVWNGIRLVLSVSAIALLVLWMVKGGDNTKLLGIGLLCSSLTACLNLYFQRRSRKKE